MTKLEYDTLQLQKQFYLQMIEKLEKLNSNITLLIKTIEKENKE